MASFFYVVSRAINSAMLANEARRRKQGIYLLRDLPLYPDSIPERKHVLSRLSQAGRLSHKRVVSIHLTTLFGRNSQFIYHETSFPSTRHRKYVYRYTPSSSVFIYREMSTLLDYLLGLYLPPFPSLSICLLPRDRPATFALLFASLISTRLRLVSSPFYRSISSFLLPFFHIRPLLSLPCFIHFLFC